MVGQGVLPPLCTGELRAHGSAPRLHCAVRQRISREPTHPLNYRMFAAVRHVSVAGRFPELGPSLTWVFFSQGSRLSVSAGRLTLDVLQSGRLGTCHPAGGASAAMKRPSFGRSAAGKAARVRAPRGDQPRVRSESQGEWVPAMAEGGSGKAARPRSRVASDPWAPGTTGPACG